MKTSVICILAVLALSGASARELTGTYSTKASCYARATSITTKDVTNAVEAAYAGAEKIGCSATLSPEELVVEMIDEFYFAAEVIVKTYTDAFAWCSTFGNAYGCAASFAVADGKARALIDLHASAWSKAINECEACDPTAQTDVNASLVVELLAEAKSKAAANVCVGPNQTASAYAFSSCTSQVLAHGFGYAFAKAMIAGGCTQLSAEAISEVDLFIQADPYCACNGYLSICINGNCRWEKQNWDFVEDSAIAQYKQLSASFEARCSAIDQLA